MTRVIPETDSSDDVNLNHLLAIFIPGQDDPISQSIGDVLAASPAGTTNVIVPRFVAGQSAARGQLASDATDKIYVCITPIAAGSTASRVPLDRSRNWKLTSRRR